MASRPEALQKAQPVCSSFPYRACYRIRERSHTNEEGRQYLYFPCGLIRGALASMGINATVQAESQDLPGATFQIKTVAPRT